MSSAPGRDRLPTDPTSGPVSADAMDAVCPFLRSRDGAWSSAWPSVDLRCWALRPAVTLTVAKQRDLCVTAAHRGCATFAAAVSSGQPDGTPNAGTDDAAGLWPDTRPVPLALEPVRGIGRMRIPDAIGGQVLLAGLMTAALVIFVIARSGTPSVPGGIESPSPTLTAVVTPSPNASEAPEPTAEPTPGPTPTAIVTPEPTPAPTPTPTATPEPTPGPSATPARTYTVKKSDRSLYDIGVKLGIPWKKIALLNGIKGPQYIIHPGDVLILP